MITFYDNKGKTTDRYSMDVQVTLSNGSKQYDTYSFSEDAYSPQGVNMFNGTFQDVGHEDDYQIDYHDLPNEVQKAVCERLLPEDIR